MELILIVGVAMIMAVISLISMLSQTRMIVNNQIKWQWHKHRIPTRESMQLAVKSSSRSDYKKRGQ